MKKFIFSLMVAMLSFVSVANAQEYAYSSNKFLDNTYAGVTVGATTPLDFNSVFPLNTVAGLKLGKDFTPVVGMNVEGLVTFGDNNSTWYRGYVNPSKTFVKGVSVGVNGTLNLTNLVLGYREGKVFHIGVEAGLGWLHMFPDNLGTGTNKDDLMAKTALTFDWALGSQKAWSVFVEPVVYWNLTRQDVDVQFNKEFAQVGLQVGATYRFKTSNGTHSFKKYDITAMNSEINALRAENEALRNRAPEVVEKVIEKQVPVQVGTRVTYVLFAFDSSELTEDAKKALDTVTGPVEVVATASPEGTTEHNQALSNKRAQAVTDYLTGLGVEVTKTTGLGVVGDASNRVAIVTQK